MRTSHLGRWGVGLWLFSWVTPLMGQMPAPEIVKKVGETYHDLQAFEMEASITSSLAAGTVSGYSGTQYELAVVKPEKVRLRINHPDRDVEMISDGQTTWTYNARRKEYMKESVAAFAGEEGEEQANADEERDIFSQAQQSLVARYVMFPRFASAARLQGDDRVKVGGNKVDCFVVEVPTSRGSHRLWIDKERFLVLRHKEILNTTVSGMSARMETTTSIKRIQIGTPSSHSLFTFTPPAKAKEVAILDLPGMRVNLTGKVAARFNLKDVQGGTVNLADLRGKVVLLDFWATWCAPCRKELPSIDKLAREYQDKGVVVLGVRQEDTGTVKDFLKKNKYILPTLIDSRRTVHKQYAIRAFPTVVVINREGVVVAHYVGSRPEEQLVAALKRAGI